MSKQWPEKLRLLIRGEPGKRHVAFLSVLGDGNPVTIGPLVSDENGALVFTRAELERALNELRHESPMDYRHSSLTFPRSLLVEIQSRESIARRAEAVQPYYPEEERKLKSMLDSDLSFFPVEQRVIVNVSECTEEVPLDVETTTPGQG